MSRAIDSNSGTVNSGSASSAISQLKGFLGKAVKRHGRPERIVIDGSQTGKKSILLCDAESNLQDRSMRRVRSTLGFQSAATARVILGCIEMVHMMRKQQAKYGCNRQLSRSEQFDLLAA